MSSGKVVHVKYSDYDVFIGRPSKFGNPFRMGRDGTREDVIRKHRKWLNGELEAPSGEKPPTKEEIIEELRGKTLGCFCAPNSCHGDVYVEIANV